MSTKIPWLSGLLNLTGEVYCRLLPTTAGFNKLSSQIQAEIDPTSITSTGISVKNYGVDKNDRAFVCLELDTKNRSLLNIALRRNAFDKTKNLARLDSKGVETVSKYLRDSQEHIDIEDSQFIRSLLQAMRIFKNSIDADALYSNLQKSLDAKRTPNSKTQLLNLKTPTKDFALTCNVYMPSKGIIITVLGFDSQSRACLEVSLDPDNQTEFSRLIREHSYTNNAQSARLDLAGACELGQSLINNDDIEYKDTVSRDIFIEVLQQLETKLAGQPATKPPVRRLVKP